MVGNPYRWRATIPQLENRNATAGCLLSLLFFVPVIAKTLNLSFPAMAAFVFLYVSIIVPLGTGIMSRKYVIRRIRSVALPVLHFLTNSLRDVHVIAMQIIFNVSAEEVLCPRQTFIWLCALFCHYVLVYYHRFIKKMQIRLDDKTSLKTTIAKLVFVMIVHSFTYVFEGQFKERRFVALSFAHSVLSQHQYNQSPSRILAEMLIFLRIECIYGAEVYLVSVLINSMALALSAIIFVCLISFTDNYLMMVFLGCVNVLLPVQRLVKCVREMIEKQAAIVLFPLASWNNPQIREGSVCVICLEKMRYLSARCTPCGHVFHGPCLRLWLMNQKYCPLCKRIITDRNFRFYTIAM